MGKKRIFELARELGFTNRDLIDKLQKLGFEVKTHSSSVDSDAVRTALTKEEEERKKRTEEKRVSKGVIRRRPKGEVVRRRPAAQAAEPEAVAAPIEAAAPASDVPDAPQVEDQPSEAAAPAVEATAEAVEPTEAPVAEAAEVPAQADAAAVEAKTDADPEQAEPKKREARMARPEKRQEETYDEEDEKPDMEELGISEADFFSAERENVNVASRVAPPPPSTTLKNKQEEEKQTKIVRRIDPNLLKERLKASKRPEPPKEWGKPVEFAASPVTELVVRTDASGKRKELVDVRKEAARGRRAGARRREDMSAKDRLEHRRGQMYYPAPNRKTRTKTKRAKPRAENLTPLVKRPVTIAEAITPAQMSQQMSIKATEIISWLMRNGIMAGINNRLDHDTAVMICEHFGYEVDSQQFVEEEMLEGSTLEEAKQSHDENAVVRAPVVTVMGHVDHGKTSLLDFIRNTKVADGEAGGITQRVAGYMVETKKGPITFLDTPGHAAFTAMRARGAKTTDIVVLVVAADDGVMPQTREAINHAKAAGVPLIVAVNKMDKPDANPDRVLQQLADVGILVEEWGGDVLNRKISAKTGDGIDDLLEQIALQAEIMELRADPTLPAVGTVVEGHIHKGRGPVATVLIREGELEVGEIVVVGENIGKVRAMMADGGRTIKIAGPATPVEILGLDGVPAPGDELRVAPTLSKARELAAHRREKRRSVELAGSATVSLEDLFAKIKTGDQKELKLVIKADVQGSVEALTDALKALSTQKVIVSVISGGVGAVVESDVEFARASEAIIIGFGVRPDTKALKSARALDVDIRTYKIIYEAVDEVRLAMQGLLSPVTKEKYLGRAEVRQTFNVPKMGTVAGCAVVDGVINRSAQIRLLRDSKPVYEGRLSSLKRFKDDVREVRDGFECGMGIEKFNDIKVGDIFEAFEMIETAAVLDEPTAAQAEARP